MARFLLSLIFFIGIYTSSAFGSTGERLPEAKVLPAFSLVDHQGAVFDKERLRGQWSLVFLGFTSCPHVCPLTLSRLEAIRAELGLKLPPDNLPQIFFLAVDPERDQPVLEKYVENFHSEFIGVTGNQKELQNLVTSIGGYFRSEQGSGDDQNYNVVHSGNVAVINPQAEWVASLSPPFQEFHSADFLYRVIKGLPAE